MATNYAYNYAIIDLDTGMCINVESTSMYIDVNQYPDMVEIPVCDPDYLMKYYINGNWYEDAEGTIPWTSSLL
jgi:hypothetical protein